MPPMTTTGDISYRTAGYFSKQLLERSQPLLVLDKFGQPKPLPAHSTRTIKFRGYEHLPNQPKALTEGVTPQASKPTLKDIEATINQYGDWIELTDVLADTHEDPLIAEFSDILGEQAAIMRERFLDVKDYGGGYKPMPGEIGSVEGVRYLCTTVFEPWENGGATIDQSSGILSAGGAKADVYPVLYLAKNAFGIIPFNRMNGGKSPIVPMVLNPNIPRGGDPMGQRGSIAWKMWHGAIILYDMHMIRAEVAVSSL